MMNAEQRAKQLEAALTVFEDSVWDGFTIEGRGRYDKTEICAATALRAWIKLHVDLADMGIIDPERISKPLDLI